VKDEAIKRNVKENKKIKEVSPDITPILRIDVRSNQKGTMEKEWGGLTSGRTPWHRKRHAVPF
jgi:hypothetical protein